MPFFRMCSSRGCPEDAIEGSAHCAGHTRHRRKTHKSPRGNIYGTAKWRKARTACLRRDDYTCVRCGVNEVELGGSHKLVADHTDGNYDDPYNVDNLRTLCVYCSGEVDGGRRTASVQ